ncbi:MAG TPA: hypothetical protein VEK57_24010 [Thermoanaerobaculia bacterium]|nr:hypothetical protein [Thermoanaerobaculia bacterium]
MSWIDPNLLQLIGRGTRDDEQVPDGRHLRWFFGRLLGFPRSGFLLRRHPSYATANWDATPADPLIRQQWLTAADLGTGFSRRFPSGLTVSHAGGFSYDGGILRLDANPVNLDFGPEGAAPPFPPGPELSNPAGFVRLTIVRRQNTGHVLATGYYDGHGRYRFLDRAGVGPASVAWLAPELRELAVATRGGMRMRSSAESRLTPKALDARDDDRRNALRRQGKLARSSGNKDPVVTETLLLHGGLLEHVEVTGHDAAVQQVEWITVRDYAAKKGWTDVDRFFLPLTDAPGIYPAWSSDPGREIARQRLHLGVRTAAPIAQVPWDDPVTPLTVSDLIGDVERRYLDADDAFGSVDEAMRIFLDGELRDFIPQALVEVRQLLEPTEGGDEEDAVDSVTHPFDFVYGASADPRVARLLGLMTTDTFEPDLTFDYLVQAEFPDAWIERTLFPKRRPSDFGRGQVCLSLATAIVEQVLPPPDAPSDLQARLVPDVSRAPVQAFMELGWHAEATSLFENPDRARVFYSLLRVGDDGKVLVHEREPESKLLMPHHPTPRVPGDPRRRIEDTTVPEYGPYTWRLTGMDLWGRLTAEASVTSEVRDVIPPPASASLEAALHGTTAEAPVWSALTFAFDWTDAQELLAPDLDRFEVHLRQGKVATADAELESTWGRFEHTVGATTPPLVVHWPALTLGALPAPLIATAERAEGRITVRVGPIQAAFDANGDARVSATVRAVDTFANRGAFARRAVARRIDDTPPVIPPLPGDIALTSRPDAEGRAFYRLSWPDLSGGGRVRVLRASEAALLGASGSGSAAYEALALPARAAFLRGLALAHPDAFSPDHEQRYPATAGSHTAQFNAVHRGLTVFVLQPISAAEVLPPWPADAGAFLVIGISPSAQPRTPLVREIRAGDRSVTVSVARDLTGATQRLRLYRSRRVAELADVRGMRPVTELLVPAGTEELQLADSHLYADVDYWYRVTAHGEGGAVSPPTEPLRARPYSNSPPAAPEIVSVARDSTDPDKRVVTCVIARRDYPATLLRRARGTLDWSAAPVDFSASAPVSGGYELSIKDAPPAPAETYLYRLRVRDLQGRIAESNIAEEAP